MIKLLLLYSKCLLSLFCLLLIGCGEVLSWYCLQAYGYHAQCLMLNGWQNGKVPQDQMAQEEVVCQGMIAARSGRTLFMVCVESSDIVVNVGHYDLQVNG